MDKAQVATPQEGEWRPCEDHGCEDLLAIEAHDQNFYDGEWFCPTGSCFESGDAPSCEVHAGLAEALGMHFAEIDGSEA